jgi:hypothetical protein
MKLRGGAFSTGTTGNFQPELTPSMCNPNTCALADRTSGPIGFVVVPKSTHRSTGSSQLHYSLRWSSGALLQSVLVMQPTKNRLGHHLMIDRNMVSASFGLLASL